MTDPRRVRLCQLLLAKAARTNFPEEADTCRRKAEALMVKYGIAEADVAPPPPMPPPAPVLHYHLYAPGATIVIVVNSGSATATTGTYGQTMWW